MARSKNVRRVGVAYEREFYVYERQIEFERFYWIDVRENKDDLIIIALQSFYSNALSISFNNNNICVKLSTQNWCCWLVWAFGTLFFLYFFFLKEERIFIYLHQKLHIQFLLRNYIFKCYIMTQELGKQLFTREFLWMELAATEI